MVFYVINNVVNIEGCFKVLLLTSMMCQFFSASKHGFTVAEIFSNSLDDGS